jgi:copper chaperone
MTTIRVTGMTCDHCEAAVRAELAKIPGVTVQSIDVVPGGTSSIVVQGDVSLSALHDAIDEAGYDLVD